MAKTCKGCVYYRSLSENSPSLQPYCNYLLDTGEPRRCPVENCEKKLTLEEAMKKLTSEDKQEIIRLRTEDNVPAKTVAEKFGITKGAVFNIVSEWKKHGESAISDDEKEPDTEATVTDSEQEIVCENIPADIVTQETGNVKADDILPCAVVDAVANEIDRLYDKRAECNRKIQEIEQARANAENALTELRVFLRENGYGDVVKALDSGAKWRALQGEK